MSSDRTAHFARGNRTSSRLDAKSDDAFCGENVEVTVISPLFNESESLSELVRRISESLCHRQFEIILVDDGSTDDSWETIRQLVADNPLHVTGLRHRRNFGKAEALVTGFAEARGHYVVTIDADLQDDPAEIPALIYKLESGYDLVSGWKQNRRDPISKTLPSRFFNFAAQATSGLKLHDFNCGLKAYRREVTDTMNLYGELHRFIPILAHAEGYRITEIPVTHYPREHGKSKYGWGRLAKGALDLLTVIVLTRYLRRPGHFFGGIGLLAGTLGGITLAYLSFMKVVFNQPISSRPLFFFGILAVLFSGQMITTGIIGELVLRHNRSGSQSSFRTSNKSAIEEKRID